MNTYLQELNADPHYEAVSEALSMRREKPSRAVETFEQLASRGSVISLIALGDIYAYGRYGIQANPEKAQAYLESAENKGSVEASYRLARLNERSGQLEKAIEKLVKLSRQGFSPASFLLGSFYYRGKNAGRDIDRDVDVALSYFEIASDQGHLIARQWVGFLTRRRGGLLKKIRGTLVVASTIIPMFMTNRKDPQSDSLRS